MRAPTVLALAAGAVAQNETSGGFLASNPGGALPQNVQAPNITGFNNATVHPSTGGLAICVSGYVPVQAQASNLKFNFTLPSNQTQVTETFVEMLTAGSPAMKELMAGMQNVSGTYNIWSTYCQPNGMAPKGVQLLTHGVGFSGSYWDFAPGYSYVDVAVKHGYAAFFYDRLAVAKSEKADPINVVQSPLEVEIAHQLAVKLRNGDFAGTKFSKVIGTGHSFGSIITQAITSKYPEVLDAAVLTGFSTNTTGQLVFMAGLNLGIASQNQPLRFADLRNGYLVSSTSISQQIGFFRSPNFDPNILSLAEATKGSVTFGELFSTAAVTEPAPKYNGSVIVVNGANDLPFCSGNCTYPMDLAKAVQPKLYSSLAQSKFDSYLAPVTGHGVNLHYSAVAAYEYLQDFLQKQGL